METFLMWWAHVTSRTPLPLLPHTWSGPPIFCMVRYFSWWPKFSHPQYLPAGWSVSPLYTSAYSRSLLLLSVYHVVSSLLLGDSREGHEGAPGYGAPGLGSGRGGPRWCLAFVTCGGHHPGFCSEATEDTMPPLTLHWRLLASHYWCTTNTLRPSHKETYFCDMWQLQHFFS